jgi:hypothetical protein
VTVLLSGYVIGSKFGFPLQISSVVGSFLYLSHFWKQLVCNFTVLLYSVYVHKSAVPVKQCNNSFFYVLATEGSKSLKSEASECSKQETTAADPDLNMINSYLEDTSEIRAVPDAFFPALPSVFWVRIGVDTGNR